MTRGWWRTACGLALAVAFAAPAAAEKSGGVLKVYFFDSPASMSIHEEATIASMQAPAQKRQTS